MQSVQVTATRPNPIWCTFVTRSEGTWNTISFLVTMEIAGRVPVAVHSLVTSNNCSSDFERRGGAARALEIRVCFTSYWCLKALISVARRLRRAKRWAGRELAMSIFAMQSTRFDLPAPRRRFAAPALASDTGADCHPHFHDQVAVLLLLSFLISPARSPDLYTASPIATGADVGYPF